MDAPKHDARYGGCHHRHSDRHCSDIPPVLRGTECSHTSPRGGFLHHAVHRVHCLDPCGGGSEETTAL